MPSFQELRVFVAVVEQHSFKKAAMRVGITPASVSQHVKALEARLNVVLLKRTTRKSYLTEIGQKYYEQAKRVLAEVDELANYIEEYTASPRGVLRVTYGNYFGERYIVPLIPKFLEKYPSIKVELYSGEHFEMLEDDATDVLFGMIAPAGDQWVQRKVLSTRYVICSSPDYFKRAGIPKHPQDLSSHRYITHSRRTPPVNALFFNNNQTVILDSVIEIDNGRDMIGLALQGAGLVKAPDFMVEYYLQSGQLIEALGEYCIADVPVYLYYLSTKFVNPKIRCFIDFMMAHID